MSEQVLNIKIDAKAVKPAKSPVQLRDEFLEVIEGYKGSPKFEAKKEELDRKLAKLEAAIKPKKVEPVEPAEKVAGEAKKPKADKK